MPRKLVLGALLFAATAAAEAPYHPEPRVIVNCESVRGPHDQASVQRAARKAWGKIIRCYESHARGDRGEVRVALTIEPTGRVTEARRKSATLSNRELADCLMRTMEGLPMPKASKRSVAEVSVQVAPGDAPQDDHGLTAAARTPARSRP